MPIDGSTTAGFDFSLFFASFYFVLKAFFLVAFGLYFIFSLIVIRQVQLMTDTLMTEVSPLIRAITILHAGFALGIIILFVGLF